MKSVRKILVLPAAAGIQRLKSLDPGQKHAGMTIKWDSSGALVLKDLYHLSLAMLFEAIRNAMTIPFSVKNHSDCRHVIMDC